MSTQLERITQRYINRERRRLGIRPVRWSRGMYFLAKRHAKKMSKVGHLFHSKRPALLGGENAFYCTGSATPRMIVKTWMSSPGHRHWLLSSRVKFAAVGISKSRRGTYAAWSFHRGTPDYISIGLIDIFVAFVKILLSPLKFASDILGFCNRFVNRKRNRVKK